MNKKISLSEVEERVRATLQARSQDSAEPASAPAPATVSAAGRRRPPGGAAPVASEEAAEPVVAMLPVSRDAGPARKRLVAAAAAVAVLTGVAVQVAGRSDEGGQQADVQSALSSQGPAPEIPEMPRACGTELPVAVSVPGASPVEGPMPGADPAEPGQVVVHWQRADLTVEARWPARPQVVYDLDGPADPPSEPAFDTWTVYDEPPSATFDLIGRDGNVPEIVVEGAVTPQGGCDVMEFSHKIGDRRGRTGLQFLPGGDGTPSEGSVDSARPDMGMPYERVDLNPLVDERREVTEAPDTVLACRGVDEPSHSGPTDRQVRGDTAPEVLQAFLASRAGEGAPRSGYVEMIQPDGTITYGHDPEGDGGDGWTVLVTATPGSGGDDWHLGGWHKSGC